MPTVAPDYCIFWIHRWWPWADPWWACMQKGEWSAWVQAIFSVAAILAAIGIALWQRRTEQVAARATARATVMVVGAAIDSKLHMLIATVMAVIDEHSHPSRPTAVERGVFVQTLFAKAELPTEDQMLLLASAVPAAAATMANGVAAIKRVLVGLDFVVSAPTLTTLSDTEILAHYLGTKNNLHSALNYLKAARAEMQKYATAA
ncbi:hypothetical protein [Variovorax sp. W6]|uniref:hypothetical protein n=1 Tax=Variovorax sp. W6 TaxID=3093895 RepID=UPI003D800ECB